MNDNNTKKSGLPRHICIIMDGNGRWASKRFMPRQLGHKAGMDRVIDIVEYSSNLGIEYLSLYAFSTENWKRPAEEVNALMELLVVYIRNQLNSLKKNNVKIHIMGDKSALPNIARREIERSIKETENNTGMVLNLGINYGGRDEIIKACKELYRQVQNENMDIEKIDENMFSNYLYTANQPDPDLLIRPGSEQRLSNFMIYQTAYTELYFTDVLWPDFGKTELDEAIDEYRKRKRRFGGL
ncbi:isoprenyl transferase [Microaceticoccus formicicus]|uniref:isoprenyl transferase n=1 Tax=Microaceticoccus formicicus TaxID=3118105 RepID=UPI003CD0320B|nr:isoprenyl transferase [Peptoniphilaceae bacterium AMB_02]